MRLTKFGREVARRSRWVAVAAIAGATGLAIVAAFAAAMTLTSGSLSVFRPADLPSASPSGSPASSCTAGSATAKATADTYVRENAPSNNSGATVDLVVRAGVGTNHRSLVTFTLPAIPSGCSLSSATLQVYATVSASGRTIQAFQVNRSWTETDVTWNNQPPTTGTAATSPSLSTAGWQTWTVTTLVQAMYSGTNNGFLLSDQTEGSDPPKTQTYQSREAAANTAQLVINWS